VNKYLRKRNFLRKFPIQVLVKILSSISKITLFTRAFPYVFFNESLYCSAFHAIIGVLQYKKGSRITRLSTQFLHPESIQAPLKSVTVMKKIAISRAVIRIEDLTGLIWEE